jgi:segregation and condensation protein B
LDVSDADQPAAHSEPTEGGFAARPEPVSADGGLPPDRRHEPARLRDADRPGVDRPDVDRPDVDRPDVDRPDVDPEPMEGRPESPLEPASGGGEPGDGRPEPPAAEFGSTGQPAGSEEAPADAGGTQSRLGGPEAIGDRPDAGEPPVGEGSGGAGNGDEPGEEAVVGAELAPDDDELAAPERLRAALEAVLLVVDTPTSAVLLAQVLGRPVAAVDQSLQQLRDEYDADRRGLDLREVAGGWRLYTRSDFAPYVERFVLEGQQTRLTQAALETLAVIAYRQPITRSRVSAVRGVNVDAVMRTLLSRGLVEECGSDAETGGGLYRTTPFFLERLGISSLDELPSLAPLLPDTSQLDDVALST